MYSIDELRHLLAPIAENCGLNRLSVFGSIARGDATADSDVDLLVDLPNGWGLFALGKLYKLIEDALKCPFDLVTSGIDDKAFLDRIRRDEVLIYERTGA